MNWFSIILLLGALQGFILFLSIFRLKRGDRERNKLLSFMILIISITLFGRVLYSIIPPTLAYQKMLFIGDLVVYFYGPLLYIYLEKLFKQPAKYHIKLFIHFIPVSVFIILVLPSMFFSHELFVNYVNNILGGFHLLEFMAIVQNAVYILLNFRLLKSFLEESNQVSSIYPQVKFYRILLIATSLVVLIWIVSFSILVFLSAVAVNFPGYLFVWLALSSFIIGLGYYTLGNPEIFDEIVINEHADEEKKLVPADERIYEIAEMVSKIMSEEKPYLDSKLSLNGLAQIVGVTPHLLSKAINEVFQKNFFEYVNTYRVDEFKNLAQKKESNDLTLLALAFEAGFNSKTTFNTAFKKITSKTPRDFYDGIVGK